MFTRSRRPRLEELWITELQLWTVSQAVSVLLVDLEPYEPCTIAGIVLRWRIDPGRDVIAATVFDGTGVVTAEWSTANAPTPRLTGPRGIGLVLEGIPQIGPDGGHVMTEPAFRRTPFPTMG
jgi:hypothetical protein